ncbi:MAG: 3-oxoacyl-ACP reductase FabG [Prevotella sp.]|jgi:3-oxoacyl-[acyl-carrier protein] reductase|nr:3-oxoacyl-ACP reductase FabG [Prevotella sp.]MDY6242005.1 3-oxoacyl-ACP reductase FabG [Prevotella sp.]
MKYILVTGGSRGIGRAVCVRLAKMGMPVIINYRSNEAEAQKTKALVEAEGVKAELLPFDVSDEAQVTKAMDQWEDQHPDDYIYVLVNNAGIRRDGVMFMMSDDDWHDVLRTTLDGFFFITRRVLKHMMPRHRGGRIVNLASLSGLCGIQGQANYSAAKAGLIGATKALALEVAPRQITVNAVAPGFVETDMTHDLDHEALVKTIPMRRFAKPEEVAEAVAFLASEGAAYITGDVISINGGLYM